MATIIGLAVSIMGLLITMISKLFSISSRYGELMNKVETNERRDNEERNKNSEKLKDIYSRLNSHDTVLARLSSDISNINSILCKLDGKVDRLIENK